MAYADGSALEGMQKQCPSISGRRQPESALTDTQSSSNVLLTTQ